MQCFFVCQADLLWQHHFNLEDLIQLQIQILNSWRRNIFCEDGIGRVEEYIEYIEDGIGRVQEEKAPNTFKEIFFLEPSLKIMSWWWWWIVLTSDQSIRRSGPKPSHCLPITFPLNLLSVTLQYIEQHYSTLHYINITINSLQYIIPSWSMSKCQIREFPPNNPTEIEIEIICLCFGDKCVSPLSESITGSIGPISLLWHP